MALLNILFRYVFVFTLFILISSCADPKYADPTQNKTSQNTNACQYTWDSEALCLKLDWLIAPASKVDSEAILTFRDLGGNLIDPDFTQQNDIWAFLFMPGMNHPSKKPIVIERLTVGIYKLTQVYFSMGRDWDLHISKLPGQINDDFIISIPDVP